MKYQTSLIIFSTLSLAPLNAQQPVVQGEGNLAVNPEQDQFDFALQQLDKAGKEKTEWRRIRLFKQAGEKFYSFLEKFPRSEKAQVAMYNLGYCYTKSARLSDAKQVFSSLVSRYGKGEYVVKAARYLAVSAESSKDYKSAERYYELIQLQSEGKDVIGEISFRRGVCFEHLNKVEEAIKCFEIVIRNRQPTSRYSQQAKLRIGHLAMKQKNYGVAQKAFIRLNQDGIDRKIKSEGVFFSGLCHYYLGKLEESAIDYKAVILAGEGQWKQQAIVSLISVYYTQEDYEAVMLNSKLYDAQLNGPLKAKKDILIGQTHLKKKEFRLAIEAFNSVIELNPQSIEAYESAFRKILCYYNLKSKLVTLQVNDFIKKYGTQFASHPFMHKALLLQAETFFEAKEYKSAISVFTQIQPDLVGPGSAEAMLFKKAWCYGELNQYRDAVDTFSQLLRDHPNVPQKLQVLAKRAQYYNLLEDTPNAIKDYSEVTKLAPKTQVAGLCLQALGRIYAKLKDHNKMVASYKKLLEDTEELEDGVKLNAYYWCAVGEFKLGKYEETITYIKLANQLDSGEYAKKLRIMEVLSLFQLKNKTALVTATKNAIKIGITNDIPEPVFRWLGSQSYKAGEFADAEAFLGYGVDKLKPDNTPAYFWAIYAKSQYYNKHYQWAIQSITHALNLESDPANKVNSLLYRALCEYGLSKPELSMRTAAEALNMKPSGKTKAMLLKLLGDIHFNSQDFKQASIYFASITEFYQDSEILPYAIAMIIRSLEASNKPSDAEIFRRRLKKEFPNYDMNAF